MKRKTGIRIGLAILSLLFILLSFLAYDKWITVYFICGFLLGAMMWGIPILNPDEDISFK